MEEAIQPELSLTRPGIQTYIWQVGPASILIEVFDDGRVAVNGDPVEAAPAHGDRGGALNRRAG